MLHFISLFFHFLSLDPTSQPAPETRGDPHRGTHVRHSPVPAPEDAGIGRRPPWLSLPGLPEEEMPPLSTFRVTAARLPASVCFADRHLSLAGANGVSACLRETLTSPRGSWLLLSVIQAAFWHFVFAWCFKSLFLFKIQKAAKEVKAGPRWAVGWKRKETQQSKSCALPEEFISHDSGYARRAFNLNVPVRQGKVSVRHFFQLMVQSATIPDGPEWCIGFSAAIS